MTIEENEFEFDPDSLTKPVTRIELWRLLMQVDLLVHTARTMAFAAAYGNKELVEEYRLKYKEIDDEFSVLRDKLVGHTGPVSE